MMHDCACQHELMGKMVSFADDSNGFLLLYDVQSIDIRWTRNLQRSNILKIPIHSLCIK